jgi:dienelactone hydrolase
MLTNILRRSFFSFGMDFSNLNVNITTEGLKNYTIKNDNPIDGYITKNHINQDMHTVIMIHEWWGFNRSIVSTAEVFSNPRIRVFVPDLYRGLPAVDAEVNYFFI